MNSPAPTPALDQLQIPSDQRATLRAFVHTLKGGSDGTRLPEMREQQQADAFRHSAASEFMSDKAPIGERAKTPAAVAAPTSQEGQRACLLIITADVGRTEAIARATAQDLGRDLLPVDLSRVVSRFIAETEKHLEEVFDLAGEDNSILFFDEADVLFGSSGDVAGSHFADQEVGYLLHHIEGFNGISILTVHAGTPIHDDVLRRFTCVVRV